MTGGEKKRVKKKKMPKERGGALMVLHGSVEMVQSKPPASIGGVFGASFGGINS